jgi:hypothetical protein
VEIVQNLQPDRDLDIARLFRDDAAWMQAVASRFMSDVQCVVHVIGKHALTYTVRDGRIARAEFYTDRREVREAVGLEE